MTFAAATARLQTTDAAAARTLADTLQGLGIHGQVRAVLDAKGVTLSNILSDSRLGRVSTARGWLMWVLREVAGFSLPHLGLLFRRDHTTVLYRIREKRVHAFAPLPVPVAPLADPERAAVAQKADADARWDERQAIAAMVQRRADRAYAAKRMVEGSQFETLAGQIRRGEDA